MSNLLSFLSLRICGRLAGHGCADTCCQLCTCSAASARWPHHLAGHRSTRMTNGLGRDPQKSPARADYPKTSTRRADTRPGRLRPKRGTGRGFVPRLDQPGRAARAIEHSLSSGRPSGKLGRDVGTRVTRTAGHTANDRPRSS